MYHNHSINHSYVNELIKMKETFIDPLLHPYSASTPASPAFDTFPVESPRDSIDHLPIASRFLSPTPFRSESPTKKEEHPEIDNESLASDEEDEAEDRLGKSFSQTAKAAQMSLSAKHNHPRSPYGTASRMPVGKYGTTLPFPSRSHQSLPPPPRVNQMAGSTQSLGRQSVHEHEFDGAKHLPKTAVTAPSRSVLQKFKKSSSTPVPIAVGGAVSPTALPEDLRKCLEVIEGGILEGHMKLSESLRKRYEDQYPLVRSLADVFVTNVSHEFDFISRL